MKITPSAIGYLSPIAAPRDDRRLRSTFRPASTRGRQPARTTAPWGSYKRRLKRTHASDDPRTYPAHCLNFKYCDETYQKFTPDQRETWRRGIKRPHQSAYDLWMSEALHAANNRWPLPDAPSISGGYSLKHVRPGTKIPTSPCPKGTEPPSKVTRIQAEVQETPYGPYTVVTWDYTPEPPPPYPWDDYLVVCKDYDPRLKLYVTHRSTELQEGFLYFPGAYPPNAPFQAFLYFTYPTGLVQLLAYFTINIAWELIRFDQKPWLPPPTYPADYT